MYCKVHVLFYIGLIICADFGWLQGQPIVMSQRALALSRQSEVLAASSKTNLLNFFVSSLWGLSNEASALAGS